MTELNTPEIAHYIGGGQHAGAGTRTQAVYNPATGQVSAKVKLGNQQDIDNAVASAQAAFPAWADTPPLRRARRSIPTDRWATSARKPSIFC